MAPEKNCIEGDKDLGICNACIDNYYLDYNDGKCKSIQENNEFKQIMEYVLKYLKMINVWNVIMF